MSTDLFPADALAKTERGKIMLEAAAVAAEIRTLNMRIGGLRMTPKAYRAERLAKLIGERKQKLERLAELKKQYDALSDSKPAK